MKSQLRYPAVAIVLLGGPLLLFQLGREIYPGSHLTIAGYIFLAFLTAVLLLEAGGLYFDRVGAWAFAVPLAALLVMGAVTAPPQDRAPSALLVTPALGLFLVTTARAFHAWRHRSRRT